MDRKQVRFVYFYEFKLGHTVAEATHRINYAFGLDTVSERTVQRWFTRFQNGHENLDDEDSDEENKDGGDKSIEDKEEAHGPSSSADTNDQLVEAGPNTTADEQQTQAVGVSHPNIIHHPKHLEKSKKLDVWVTNEFQHIFSGPSTTQLF